jgi:hypothetical protein
MSSLHFEEPNKMENDFYCAHAESNSLDHKIPASATPQR